jgi:Uma2 family endonuclease
MVAVRTDVKPAPLDEDNRVFIRVKEWRDFEAMLAIRGDAAGVRMYYLDGVIELMSPSNIHEYRKKTLARLLEQWALETSTNLNGFGSWTLKDGSKEAGAEPDECYILGNPAGRERPDLVIEVEWSHPGLAKREIYRRLGVRELWTVKRDLKLVLSVLEKDRYVERAKSKVLPKLDLAWLLSFIDLEPQSAAVRALRDDLKKKRRR